MKVLKPGDTVKLPDGRVITFLSTQTPECDGCVFEFVNCGLYEEIAGACGTGRPEGDIGIFVECKD